MLELADAVEALTGNRGTDLHQVITGATVDSRQAFPGSMFVARPGENVDGHNYVRDAFDRGAQFALIEKPVQSEFLTIDLRQGIQPDLEIKSPVNLRVDDSLAALQEIARFWRKKMDVRVIGITGSVGKSTTKEVAASVLSQRYRTLKNEGNLNNEIGLPLTLLSLNESHQCAVLEMGFYVPGEISFLCEIARPQIGMITNIGTVHAERAGTQEAIAKGKAELVQALPAAPEGVAILNYDDKWVRDMAAVTRARILYYGLSPEADIWADQVQGLGLEGISFRLHYQQEVLHLKVPLIGRHSVHTVLRSAAVGLMENLTWQEIVNGLRSGHAQLRLVAVKGQNGAMLLDDTYNASPQSMMAALNLLDELEGNKIAVLGDMLELGSYEHSGHDRVGVRAAQVADQLITVGERSKIIASAARRSGLPADAIIEFDKYSEAVEYLQEKLTEEDVVLVKGSRGMEMNRIVAVLEVRE